MKQQEFQFPSATGVCTIRGNAYFPDTGSFDTILIIHHGMAEHQQRYLPLISFLCERDCAAYIYDMASHGTSVTESGLTGWFGEKDGYVNLARDFHTAVLRAKKDHPGRKLVVMGHSMGSFICRLYLTMFPEDAPDGAIIMGSGGPNPAGRVGLAVSSLIAAVCGKKHKSKLLNQMAFGAYNKRFEGRTAFDWLTRDRKIVDQYIADPLCGYLFTAQGMNDLIHANVECNLPAWYQALPKDLEILLISGEEDPVGDYGRGIKLMETELKKAGQERVTEALFPDCRHEVLNELNRDQVMDMMLRWLRRLDNA